MTWDSVNFYVMNEILMSAPNKADKDMMLTKVEFNCIIIFYYDMYHVMITIDTLKIHEAHNKVSMTFFCSISSALLYHYIGGTLSSVQKALNPFHALTVKLSKI